MCGRFALGIPKQRLEEHFGLSIPDGYPDGFNMAPGRDVLAFVDREGRKAVRLNWGLAPYSARGRTPSSRLINARSETVFARPAFRASIRTRRCLIPAQAFYEWKENPGGRKTPFAFLAKDKSPLALAGMWDLHQNPETGATRLSCAILTMEANPVAAQVHHRMPVIIRPSDFGPWLSPDVRTTDRIMDMISQGAQTPLACRAVAPLVNSPSFDGPECLDPPPERPLLPI